MTNSAPAEFPRPAAVLRQALADSAPLLGDGIRLPDVEVSGITLDSRRVRPGDIYMALPGASAHGASFAPEAIEARAGVVLTDHAGLSLIPAPVRAGTPVVVLDDPRARMGRLAAWVYGNPARKLALCGVTGTNGKTTVAMLMFAALRAAGRTPGLIGTIVTRIGDQELGAVRTTPEAPDLQALLATMVERGVDTVAMEVSSHALELGRVDGLVFDQVIFTNLSRDHLDFHGDMAAYFAAKASLFTPMRAVHGLVCIDDEWGYRLAQSAGIGIQTYSVRRTDADWHAAEIKPGSRTTAFRLVHEPEGQPDAEPASWAAKVQLPGPHNVANAIAAALGAHGLGVPLADALRGVGECIRIPGRMERVECGQDFTVLIDYAHTPEAIEVALAAARLQAVDPARPEPGRVLVALGCGGDRDPGKRPVMGELAARLADVIVVTDDNPRSEDPAAIRAAMLAGTRSAADPTEQAGEIVEIGDRAQALRWLIAKARPGDVVLALGKGHERGQEIAGRVYPFDDRIALEAALRLRAREPEPRP